MKVRKKIGVEITASTDKSKIIYVCLDGIEEISKKIFKEREKKFRIIVECIFRDQTNRDIYEKYANYKGTAAIKLSKGKENFRIYCKVENDTDEENNMIQRIVLVKLHHKKKQKLSKKEINILESIQNNEYEYKQWYKPT